jgi:hypothetical protein
MTHGTSPQLTFGSECRPVARRSRRGWLVTVTCRHRIMRSLLENNSGMRKPRITHVVLAVGLLFGLSACTNPYDPVQRTIGGGLIGAGSGAAIGAAAAGGHGAALGAAVGGTVGAVTGLITTPLSRYRY